MRNILCYLFVPVCLGFLSSLMLAEEAKSQSQPIENDSSRLDASFYTSVKPIVQNQINLATRIERALTGVDANQVRAVRGQVLINATNIERMLRREYPEYGSVCHSQNSLTGNPQSQIYCSVYAASREMLNLAPILDRILSRRGESAIVRRLPLVSGEHHSDPVLSLAPMQRPQLGQRAIPFITNEPNLHLSHSNVIGRRTKTAIANYTPPLKPAIAPPDDGMKILAIAQQHINQAKALFPNPERFHDPRETNRILDQFAFGLDPQEEQAYAKILQQPNTGIFRVLPATAYQRPQNVLQNRLQPSVRDRHPFPVIGQTRQNFTPTLPLKLVNPHTNPEQTHLQIIPQGLDYSFMVDLGNIPIEKLDPQLQNIPTPIREAFLTYQPPQLFSQIQTERRRILSRKNPNPIFQPSLPANLERTYLVRIIQYQLPREITENIFLTPQQRLHIDSILKNTQASDTILALRPVRQRRDGSYTVIWRVLHQMPDPVIQDLETYLRY